jgi:transposase-like protein
VARKTFSKEFKAGVALQARRGEKTVAQLASKCQAGPQGAWRGSAPYASAG